MAHALALPTLAFAILALTACGGTVVLEEGGDGGGSAGATTVGTGNGTSSSNASAATATSSTGSGGCTSHQDCSGDLCIFTTGECAPPCDVETCDSCGPGLVCDACATSACPECLDCRGACLPAGSGDCDDDDPCSEGRFCDFDDNRCSTACTAEGGCEDLDEVCAPCEGSSCCGCDDCVGGCIPPRD